MPSKRAHLGAAEHNQEVILYLSKEPRFADWTAVVAFYKALHLVDAVLCADGLGHPGDHLHREEILKRTNRYRTLHRDYRALKEASLVARYLDKAGTFCQYMSADQVQRELLGHRLKRLERSARGLLGQSDN